MCLIGQSKGLAANAVVHLFASDGQHITAFCDNDGSFTVKGVPKGSHLLQAHLMQFYYPEVGPIIRRSYYRDDLFALKQTSRQ